MGFSPNSGFLSGLNRERRPMAGYKNMNWSRKCFEAADPSCCAHSFTCRKWNLARPRPYGGFVLKIEWHESSRFSGHSSPPNGAVQNLHTWSEWTVSDKYIVASWHPALADECFYCRFQLSSLRCLVAQLWKKWISLWCDSFTLCNMHNVMCSSPTFTSLQVFHINLHLVVQGDEHDTTCFHASTIWTLTSDCNKYWPSWHVELATDGSRRNGIDAASLDASCGRQGLHPKLLVQQKWTARECGLKGWKLRITLRISLVAEPNITNVYMYNK